jgi:hypothetical protein
VNFHIWPYIYISPKPIPVLLVRFYRNILKDAEDYVFVWGKFIGCMHKQAANQIPQSNPPRLSPGGVAL